MAKKKGKKGSSANAVAKQEGPEATVSNTSSANVSDDELELESTSPPTTAAELPTSTAAPAVQQDESESHEPVELEEQDPVMQGQEGEPVPEQVPDAIAEVNAPTLNDSAASEHAGDESLEEIQLEGPGSACEPVAQDPQHDRQAASAEPVQSTSPNGETGDFEDVNLGQRASAVQNNAVSAEGNSTGDTTSPNPTIAVAHMDEEPPLPAPPVQSQTASPAPPPVPEHTPPPTPTPPPAQTNGNYTPSSSIVSAPSEQQSPEIHGRRSSIASTATISGAGSSSLVSGILIVTALETIGASKEARKSQPLTDAVDRALAALKNPVPPSASTPATSSGTVDPHLVFTPLRLACETKSLPLMITSLDCIGKLVSYDFFVDTRSPQQQQQQQTNDEGEPIGPAQSLETMPLADLVTATVCECFSPSPSSSSSNSAANAATTQHDTLLLRLLSCLLSLILSHTLAVHQSSLLKAVRTVYNVFLLGRPGTVQTVAQATLGQIVGGVFSRVKVGATTAAPTSNGLATAPIRSSVSSRSESIRGSRVDLSSVAEEGTSTTTAPLSKSTDQSVASIESSMPPVGDIVVEASSEDKQPDESSGNETDAAEPTEGDAAVAATENVPDARPANDEPTTPGAENVTLASLENRRSFEGVREGVPFAFVSQNDLYIKDAFLVFRALCKLSMKPLGAESERDIKSHAMRSKLLSLHLVLMILQNHLPMFIDPEVVIISSTSRDRTPFIQAVKQYLCLALSRNAVSPVIQVFELSCEIFWRVLVGMRTKLKKEIEVLLNEIFLPILEMRNSTMKQKSILLAAFGRLAQDPQALVDIYLNYDCDRASLDNLYERLLNIVAKLGTTQFAAQTERPGVSNISAASTSPFPNTGPSLIDDSRINDPAFVGVLPESHLKRQSLECLVSVLRSLVSWAARGGSAATTTVAAGPSLSASDSHGSLSAIRASEDGGRGGSETDLPADGVRTAPLTPGLTRSGAITPDVVPADDPSRFENAKQRKTTLLEGIKKFNFKPKRGIDFLIDTGFIRSRESKDIARFLLHADGLDKAQIGEYLGEGDADNIATMHAFVDFMDFTNSAFVDALRTFLQSFRLPGEAQKIDRYMLKFAERYTQGNPGVFANADTAYVLAFSVILLNTDAHNPQVKKPMSKVEFIKNNRGIDDGKDIDEKLLSSIYDEINANEIRMKDEVEAAGPQTSSSGIASAIATVGRDLQREAYVWQSEGMASKTEALFRTLVRGQRRGPGRPTEQFYSASHFEHVKPMFEVAWMPILAGISGPLQTTDELDLITLSLEGFKQAIKIACLFDLELERNAFVTTLAKFTFLNNFGEMKAKNVEAIKTLLDVAMIDGNYLKGSWREVVTCVSQLERFQLIAQGVDSQAVPELGRKPSIGGRRSTLSRTRSRPTDEVAQETRSQHITITADMIFSTTPQLSGTAIVDFVQALSDVSWEEIQSSGLAEQPRVFCLQKLVEISYYNMSRIRLEWSAIWVILGEHFNQVTCHTNAKVSFLALDSLRQLAMRFLEKEELANFKFQKDFLKPFEYAMVHNNHPDARDMVLQCLQQMIQARVQNLRSGWRTMFGVFAATAKVASERTVVQAFDIVQRVVQEHFTSVVEYGSFADLTVCVTDFCKISKYQRVSLQAIELLKSLIPKMLTCPACPLSEAQLPEATATDDPMLKYWFPVLFAFYDVIMNGEDMEVRKRALDYLFETLKKHGDAYPPEFWDTVCKEVLFPIFAVLRSRHDVSRFSTHEDMSVWLSTTMIQALRNLVDLFTFYFDVLARMLDKLLDLLCECICQENDTLARIGTACLQQLLENNVEKLSPERWERIVSTFTQLFKTTTAYQLFDPSLLLPESTDTPPADGKAVPKSNGFAPLAPAPSAEEFDEPKPIAPVADRRRIFRQIIVKCVLQLLLIETTNELLQNEGVYTTIPPAELLRLMASLDESYRFARKFNADKELRMALWKVGFMRDLPNLLRQESTSAATLVSVLLRMYNDTQPEHVQKRAEVVDVFAPLGLDVLANYVALNPESQARNIAAWTPVCAEILQGFCSFEDDAFMAQLPRLYPLVTNTLVREMDPTIREIVRAVFVKVGVVALKIRSPENDDVEQVATPSVVPKQP